MNHFSGMEMAKQRQTESQREASLHRQAQATKSEAADRITRLPRLLAFRRARGAGAGASCTEREWRLSRS
jgi:hypothetical protein